MKQAGYSKRPRGRSFERHRQPQKNHHNGDASEGKIRGNPQQAVEKYLTLARDAASSGDPVAAENYYQYADHYYRIALANRLSRPSETPGDKKPRRQFSAGQANEPSSESPAEPSTEPPAEGEVRDQDSAPDSE